MHDQATPPFRLSPASGGEGSDQQAARPSALILGGAHGALVIARSLARRGIAVDIVANHALPLFSRHIRHRFSWDGSRNGPGPDALARLLAIARREGLAGAVLFAGGDTEARLIAENHAALASVFRLTTPPWEALQRLFDKRLMQRHAASLGIDVPLVFEPRDAQDLETMPLRFPLALKPTVRTVENAFTLAKAWRADDRAALLARWDEAAALVGADAIVVQELIPGDGEAQYSYAAVCDRGKPVAELVARRRRQYPVEFGYTSTFVETVDCPPVEDAGRRLLASLDYTGIAEVEFKHDRRDGRYKLLDVNTRIWTWAELGAAAGVDFPHAMWRIARGEATAPLRPTRDAAWMHASRDLVAAAHEMLRGRLAPAAWLRSLRRRLTFAAFALDDPLPGLVELPLALGRAVTHRLPIVLDGLRRRVVRADPAPLTPAPDSPYSLLRRRRRTSCGRAD
jgi:predicted ATP-grasp superfamily ATP-dependent carboligase